MANHVFLVYIGLGLYVNFVSSFLPCKLLGTCHFSVLESERVKQWIIVNFIVNAHMNIDLFVRFEFSRKYMDTFEFVLTSMWVCFFCLIYLLTLNSAENTWRTFEDSKELALPLQIKVRMWKSGCIYVHILIYIY